LKVQVNARRPGERSENWNWRILEAAHPAQALEILTRERVDLLIADFMMPGMSGPEFCQKVRQQRHSRLIPVLMITSVQGHENEIAGLASGADDFLVKPIFPAVIRARVAAMLRHKAAIDSLEEVESILFTLAQTVEQRDHYTAFHCQRLANYSVAMGMKLALPREELVALYRGGFLHDIGKISVPDAVLFKQSLLTDAEWEIMRLHTVRGEELCRPMKSLVTVLPIIRSHHERLDGSGYPDGLAGDTIPLLARILQITDIYDALTTARPYKPALAHDQALAILDDETKRGWRDPELVRVFREVFTDPPEAMRDVLITPSLVAMTQKLQS
jgi:putative two-component system response regulator